MNHATLLLLPGLLCDDTVWQAQCAAKVTGQMLAAGHFIPEEAAAETSAALRHFFSRTF